MELVTTIIECPKGTGQKYNYEPEKNCFKLTKVLPAGLVFPFDFGFISDTKGEDGDPLDVIVISEIQTFTGCCMDCRIIGGIKAQQTERDGETMRNDRFLAVPDVSQLFKGINSVDQLPEGIISQIESFFQNYNEQAGKKFEVLDRVGAEDAYRIIQDKTEK
jgi:inorganic pyrophosphatase